MGRTRKGSRAARAAAYSALAALVALAAWGATRTGGDWALDDPLLDPEAIAARVREAGALGPVALLALLVLQCVVAPLPSEPLMMAAGYIYGPRDGFVLALAGVTIGAGACFWLARRYGRPLAERMVRRERIDAIDERLAGRSLPAILLAVLAIRVLAFGSFDVMSYACGLFLVPFGWFVAVTAIGVVPKVFAFTHLGANVAGRPEWLGWVIVAGTFGALVVAPLLLRRRSE